MASSPAVRSWVSAGRDAAGVVDKRPGHIFSSIHASSLLTRLSGRLRHLSAISSMRWNSRAGLRAGFVSDERSGPAIGQRAGRGDAVKP